MGMQAAFRADILANRANLLAEIDGPMLRHGLQERHGQPLMTVPRRRAERPDPELLAVVKAQALRIAELQRRLGAGSDDSGTPSSKESIGTTSLTRELRSRPVASRSIAGAKL